ncbi:MAG: HAD family phosphatase [Nanoarchaeota archaeon]
MIKGIIFDKDGVIFDSEPVYAMATIKTLEKFGHFLTEKDYFEYWTRKGWGIKEFLEHKKIKIDLEEFKRMRHEIIDFEIKRKLPLIDGAEKVLSSFKGIYPLALVTSSDTRVTNLKLEISGFYRFFDFVITKEDVTNHKPHPEGFLLAADKLNINPENIVVIEDAEKGVIAAHNAGMKCIAIPNKYTKFNDFSLADVVLRDIGEITPELIKTL